MSLPNMDSFQEALLHMMRKKVELLEERLSEKENQEKQRAADCEKECVCSAVGGEGLVFDSYSADQTGGAVQSSC